MRLKGRMKARDVIIYFLICLATAVSLLCFSCESESLDKSASFVIIGSNPKTPSEYEISRTRPVLHYWTSEESFIKNADWQIELDSSKSKDLYKTLEKMLSSKKEVTTVYRPSLDMSFSMGEQQTVQGDENIPVSDSEIFISNVIYKKNCGKIINKIVIGGSDIIRVDEKYYKVNNKEVIRVNQIIKEITR